MAQFCTKCGNEIKSGSKFCHKCGSPVENLSQHISKGKANESTVNKNKVNFDKNNIDIKAVTGANSGLLDKFKNLSTTMKIIAVVVSFASLFGIYLLSFKVKYALEAPNKTPYAVLHTYGKVTANSINRINPNDMKDLVDGLTKCCNGSQNNAFLLINNARSLNSRGVIPGPSIGHVDYLASSNTKERNGHVYGTVTYWEPSTKHMFVKFLIEMKKTENGYIITDFREMD